MRAGATRWYPQPMSDMISQDRAGQRGSVLNHALDITRFLLLVGVGVLCLQMATTTELGSTLSERLHLLFQEPEAAPSSLNCDCEEHTAPERSDCSCTLGCDDCLCCPVASVAVLDQVLISLGTLSRGPRGNAPPQTFRAEVRPRVWRPPIA